MKIYHEPKVRVISRPTFINPLEGEWETDGSDGEQIAEFAGRLCFDPATEVLTRRGWVSVAEVTGEDDVMTKSPSSLALEFQRPIATQRYSYAGDMYVAEGRDISMCVTPEHRQWGYFQKGDTPDFVATSAIGDQEFAVTTSSAGIAGTIPEELTIPSVTVTQTLANASGTCGTRTTVIPPRVVSGRESVLALAYLLTHYAANGSLRKQCGSGQGITIYGREFATVTTLCETLNLPYSIWADPRNDVRRVLIGGGVQWMQFFADNGGDGKQNKKLPTWVLNLSTEVLREVWDILVRTDGHRYASGREVFFSTSPTLTNHASEVVVRLGGAVKVSPAASQGLPCFCVARKKGRPVWLNRKDRLKLTAVPYSGTVHCVTTANGILLVRRNGKTHFSGNCYLSFGEDSSIGGGHKTVKGRQGNASYLENIKKAGHGSVIEHANYGLLIEQVSRSLTHELVRHRAGFSYSQLSQRYVEETDTGFVFPPDLDAETDIYAFQQGVTDAIANYKRILHRMMVKLEPLDIIQREKVKRARQTARAALPNSTETKIVVTGNARAWRNMLILRGNIGADLEIRRMAVAVGDLLRQEAPNFFADVETYIDIDGIQSLRFGYIKV